MTSFESYTAECLKCGYTELRMGLMSFSTMVGAPDDIVDDYPVGCPKCDDVGFDVYEDEDEDELSGLQGS